jgi:hypothetical protein
MERRSHFPHVQKSSPFVECGGAKWLESGVTVPTRSHRTSGTAGPAGVPHGTATTIIDSLSAFSRALYKLV